MNLLNNPIDCLECSLANVRALLMSVHARVPIWPPRHDLPSIPSKRNCDSRASLLRRITPK